VRDAAWPVRRVAWAFEERVVWGGADAARSAAADVSWPLQRFAWAVQRRLIWPFQDAFGARGRFARAALSLCLLGAAAAAGVAGAQIGAPGTGSSPDVASLSAPASPAAVATPAPRLERGPELKGAAPSFEVATPAASGAEAGTAAAATASGGSSVATAPPAPAPVNVVGQEVPEAALEVARRFAQAFVLYEVGDADAEVRAIFRETAAPSLVSSLAERPPRQPAQGEAPRARVLNVVAGPRYGRSASISVSLLRLGGTSELRLAMERTDGGWLVSDVRG